MVQLHTIGEGLKYFWSLMRPVPRTAEVITMVLVLDGYLEHVGHVFSGLIANTLQICYGLRSKCIQRAHLFLSYHLIKVGDTYLQTRYFMETIKFTGI